MREVKNDNCIILGDGSAELEHHLSQHRTGGPFQGKNACGGVRCTGCVYCKHSSTRIKLA